VEGEDLVDAARAAGIEPVDVLIAGESITPQLLASVSTLPHPSRVIAIYRRGDLPSRALPVGLALWRVADPGNVGTLIRTADAFGPAAVALSSGCADPTSAKALRASAGAIFRVPIARFADAARPQVALVARAGVPLPELELGDAVSFVLGAEREGLPDDVVRQCDEVAHIPQAASAESLNVAVAGAVALYELRRREVRERT
jgi:TrmH family RNA methyltransferase